MRHNQLSITKRGAGEPRDEARAHLGSGAQRGPACGDTAAPFAYLSEASNNLIHTNYSPKSSPARVSGRLSLVFQEGLSLLEFDSFMACASHVFGLFFHRERAVYGRR